MKKFPFAKIRIFTVLNKNGMNIEAYKNQIIKKLIDVQDEKLLEQIESILNGSSVVAHNVEGKSLTKSDYIERIESISESVSDGAETYTSEQVRNHILSQNR
jgi:hypothetical protein